MASATYGMSTGFFMINDPSYGKKLDKSGRNNNLGSKSPNYFNESSYELKKKGVALDVASSLP